MKKEIKADLLQQYQTNDVKDIFNVATFLDPRYNELAFLSTTEKEEILDNVESEPISICTWLHQNITVCNLPSSLVMCKLKVINAIK